MGIMIVDNPDSEIRVSEDKDFVSLRPGETWSTTSRLYSPSSSQLLDDIKAEDVYRCQFNRLVEIDWWDCGHVEDGHVDTVFTAPCFRAKVLTPAGNGKCPRLVVPASNVVDFRMVS